MFLELLINLALLAEAEAEANDPTPHLPRLWEAERFPSAGYALDQELLCRRALWWVEGAIAAPYVGLANGERLERLRAWRDELERRMALWDALHKARRPNVYSEGVSREALATLRFHLPKIDWDVGLMPPVLLEIDYPPIPEQMSGANE